MNTLLKILALASTILTASSACAKNEEIVEPVDYVSTLVGTLSKHSLSTGNTYPAIARPWGTHFWTPQTGADGNGWLYVYTDDKIKGFLQVHQPSPWIGDYGSFSIMPSSKPVWEENARASWFSHKAETALPYFYSVYLADHDTFVEMTPTERAAAFRITYPEAEMSYLVVDCNDGGSDIYADGKRIYGYSCHRSARGDGGGLADNFHNWFIIESDTPFETIEKVEGPHAHLLIGYRNTSKGQVVNLKIASSFIDYAQAETNLAELGDGSLDRIKAEGRARWNDILGRITIEDNNIDNLRKFYSCLYRSVLFPHDFSEITKEGKRVHYSPHTGEVCEGYLFTDTGVWDTFRCLFPLMNLLYPEMSAKVQEGLVNHWKESGFLPEWSSPGHRNCMVGNNSASVVADAYLKGMKGYDAEELWKAVVHGANDWLKGTASGRLGYESYNSLGYVPCDIGLNESAARTLEYAYDDWCIYEFGKALGKGDEELAQYKRAALNYKNLYNPEYHLMQGRKADGSWNEPFSRYKWGGDFTEGNALHYTWSVFHDVQGLIDLMGGEENFVNNLDEVFEIPPIYDESYYRFVIHEIREMQIMNMGNYAHGNQPIQHMLYLYDWGLQPWKSQARIREVMDKFYTTGPDGYCGDEDNGQTSAWYVFSALGFYPVCPGIDQYALGTPIFKKATINLSNGKKCVISAPDNSKENFYIENMKINGAVWNKNYINWSDIVGGAKISFKMNSEPNLTRGTGEKAKPYSFTDEK